MMNTNGVIFENENSQNLDRQGKTLSAEIQRLTANYEKVLEDLRPRGEIAAIHVDEIASKVAFFYERVRKIIDWKEEHLLRRGAIQRTLKRRLISEISNQSIIPNVKPEKVAEPIILELIRGGHFANDKIPQTKIAEVEKVLRKYLFILEKNPLHNSINIKDKINLYNWLLEIAACEIEEVLDPPLKEGLLINFMTDSLLERIKLVPGTGLSEEEVRLQTYIAVHRALFQLDAPIISYRLLKYHYFPQWDNLGQEELERITANIVSIWKRVEEDLGHPFRSQFQKISEKYDTIYLIISDILEKISSQPQLILEKFSNPQTVQELVKEIYDKRLSTLKSRLIRAAIYSTLSIFVAGGVSLFIFEVPLAKLFYGKFSFLAMTVDILIPTLVMFLMVAIIRLPKEGNFKRVLLEVDRLLYPSEERDIYEIRKSRKRGLIMGLLISLLYAVTTIISIVLVFTVFRIGHVPITSLYLDTLNVAMVVFAGLIIRQRAKEMTVEEKTSFGEFLLDVLSTPVGKLGQWLSVKWKEYNIVSVFFTALVDVPFLTLTEFIENWSNFIKEKKAEIR